MLEDIMHFVETAWPSGQCYFVINARDGLSFEILLKRSRSPNVWQVRVYQSDRLWLSHDAKGLVAYLNSQGADLEEFQMRLTQSGLEHVMHAEMLCERGQALFGEAAITKARQGQEAFALQLKSTLSKVLLKRGVVEGEGCNTPRRIGHLRVVSSTAN